MTEFKKAAADTAHDVKKSVEPNDSSASKPSNDKTVLESVSVTLAPSLRAYMHATCACCSLCPLGDHMHCQLVKLCKPFISKIGGAAS